METNTDKVLQFQPLQLDEIPNALKSPSHDLDFIIIIIKVLINSQR